MQIKDLLPLSFSVVALLLSIFATLRGMRDKQYEVQRTVRDQLARIMSELIEVSTDSAKLWSHQMDDRERMSAQAMSRIFNQKNFALAR